MYTFGAVKGVNHAGRPLLPAQRVTPVTLQGILTYRLTRIASEALTTAIHQLPRNRRYSRCANYLRSRSTQCPQ